MQYKLPSCCLQVKEWLSLSLSLSLPITIVLLYTLSAHVGDDKLLILCVTSMYSIGEDVTGGTTNIQLKLNGFTLVDQSFDLCDTMSYIGLKCPVDKTTTDRHGMFDIKQTIPSIAPQVCLKSILSHNNFIYCNRAIILVQYRLLIPKAPKYYAWMSCLSYNNCLAPQRKLAQFIVAEIFM